MHSWYEKGGLDSLHLVTTCCRQTEPDFECVVDEPLETCIGQILFPNEYLEVKGRGEENLPVKVPIMTIRTGRPFQRPLNPILL